MNRAADPRAGVFESGHVTVITPPRGLASLDLRELWAYRELLWVLTLRDVRVRYRQTVLGAAWAVLQPVLAMVVFSVFFGRLAGMPSDGLPYPIFVYAGLLPWQFFATAVSNSGQSVVGAGHLVNKVYFPRLIIPLASIGVALVDFLIASTVLLGLMAWFGVGLTPGLLAVPLLGLILMLAALGIGTLLSALTVAYRDFRHVLPFMVQLWLFATPVIYPVGIVPEGWRWLLNLNPMTGVVSGFRSAFLGQPFDAGAIVVSAIVSLGLFLWGVVYFERVERRFADIL